MSAKRPRERAVTQVPEDYTQVVALNRLGTMLGELLAEQHRVPLDASARARLRQIYLASLAEAHRHLPTAQSRELGRFSQPFTAEPSLSDDELRLAHAQLIGWLEGLFTGDHVATVINAAASPALATRAAGELPGHYL